MRTFLTTTLPQAVLLVSPVLFLTIIGFGGYYIYQQHTAYFALQAKLAEQTEFTASTTKSLAESIQLIEKNLIETKTANESLIQSEQNVIASLTQDLQKVTGTVGVLDKLRTIDPELLQKYSKVYFLNEHYTPSDLAQIPTDYTFETSKSFQFHARALYHLVAMVQDARAAGMTLSVKSAYRSFSEQANLKTTYTVTYGSGANKFSADQGYSEHQLGTTVDLTTKNLKGGLTGFEKTPEYTWLTQNAYKYGFILSYPAGNSYYVYEPWHWRYVGVALAMKLHDQGINFYDMDQRAIDETLLNFFD